MKLSKLFELETKQELTNLNPMKIKQIITTLFFFNFEVFKFKNDLHKQVLRKLKFNSFKRCNWSFTTFNFKC